MSKLSRRNFVNTKTLLGVAAGATLGTGLIQPQQALAAERRWRGVWMRVHGNAVSVAENINYLGDVAGFPASQIVGVRQGWGATFRGGGGRSTWFHYPVPAPNVADALDDPSSANGASFAASAQEIYMDGLELYLAGSQINLSRVDLWGVRQGGGGITVSSGLTETYPQRTTKTFSINRFRVWDVVGVSMLIRFLVDTEVTFFGLGARFLMF